jgi:hypothetical protein
MTDDILIPKFLLWCLCCSSGLCLGFSLCMALGVIRVWPR